MSAGGWQAGLFFSSPLQRRFLEILEECGSSPLWEYFDKTKLVQTVLNAPVNMSSLQMTRIYSLLTSLLYAGGYEIPVKFMCPVGQGEVESRTRLRSASSGSVVFGGSKPLVAEDEIGGDAGEDIPAVDVPDFVVSLLKETYSVDDAESDLYKLYAQLRHETVERQRLEKLVEDRRN